MRLVSLFVAFVCGAQLAGCAGTQQSGLPATLAPFAPNGAPNEVVRQIRKHAQPENPIVGVYVSEHNSQESSSTILEYQYTGKGAPLCSLNLSPDSYLNSIQSDSKNELIVPNGNPWVYIYKESKQLCLSSIPAKQFVLNGDDAIDGFSLDGKTYYIAAPSRIYVCKGSNPSCKHYVTNADIGTVAAVTADASGVYASTSGSLPNSAALWYWKGASGSGALLSGYVNKGPGGLYFDGFGNLLSIDSAGNGAGPVLYVYSGCPTACKAHGPFGLGFYDKITYGSLGNGETTFMALNQNGSIDVYRYDGIYGITFLSSNGTGLSPSAGPIGIAQLLN
ncbi:MAG: hypothetical protein JO104_11185 [Candidatus Eremiobacteraeota bacterium]|nr:hypothetical protein [Candidatus Eremiobacteraeota bacterium]